MKRRHVSAIAALLCGALISMAQLPAPSAGQDQLTEWSDDGPERRDAVFVVSAADYPPVTRFVFLETRAARIDDAYRENVKRFVRALGRVPGFKASMTLADIDRKRMVIYYQFNSQSLYEEARKADVLAKYAGPIQQASTRFEDFGAAPQEQINSVTNSPDPTYSAEFKYGDGVGINEAVVNPGRTQDELTYLMRHAGIVGATPQDAPGWKDFTFHIGTDGSRNMNLLHYTTFPDMTVAAIYPLAQGLINGGGTGCHECYGPDGPAKLGLHVYGIVNIQNAR